MCLTQKIKHKTLYRFSRQDKTYKAHTQSDCLESAANRQLE